MNIVRNAAPVLVASDKLADATLVSDQLKSDFSNVLTSVNAQTTVQDFESSLPAVLVLAFDSLEKCQRYYLGLYRQSAVLRGHAHRTVILCHKDEVSKAFDSCKRDYFDDYVLYWPASYDGSRLAMSVWIAARPFESGHEDSRQTPAALARTQRVGELARSMGEQLLIADLSPGTANRGSVLVMVVEDDELMQQLVRHALGGSRYEPVFAGDATSAMTQLDLVTPQVILMDIRLPGVDGLVLTRHLKSSTRLASIPVVMMTGDSRRETVLASLDAGATGFVVKPFTRESLTAKLQEALCR